jgi:hypothetical protein
MKKLIFIALVALFATGIAKGQEYIEYTLFDMSGVTGDTLAPVSLKDKSLVEIDFTDVNCDVLDLKIGYTITDTKPAFLETSPGVPLVITMDKTVYTETYLGVEVNQIVLDCNLFSGNYLWIGIVDDATCTHGDILLRFQTP